MQRIRIGWVVVIGVVLASAGFLPAFAQEDGYTRYVTEDGTFGLFYPSGWGQEFDDHFGTVDLYFDDGGMFIYTPDALKDWQVSGTDAETFLRLLAPDWGAVSGDVKPLMDYAYMLLENEDEDGEPYTNLVFAGALDDDTMVLIDAFVYDNLMPEYVDEVLLVFHTMDASKAGAQPVAVSDEMIGMVDEVVAAFTPMRSLSDYGTGWTAAIAELQAANLIPEGGTLLFSEDYAYFTGKGNFYTPLARNAPRTNFVMAAKLLFTPSASTELEMCTLGMRVNWLGDVTAAYLDVGYTNEGQVFYLDVPQSGEESAGFGNAEVVGGEAHTFTIIVIGDAMNVYLDGELILDNVLIEVRSGSWGLGLMGQDVTALCEARDIWVYALD